MDPVTLVVVFLIGAFLVVHLFVGGQRDRDQKLAEEAARARNVAQLNAARGKYWGSGCLWLLVCIGIFMLLMAAFGGAITAVTR